MYITDSQLSSNWSSSTRTMSKLLSRGVGGGGRGYSTNISEEESRWRFETLTMFRTKIFWKYLPCLGQNPQFYNPALDKEHVHRLGQTCAKLRTPFGVERLKIPYPVHIIKGSTLPPGGLSVLTSFQYPFCNSCLVSSATSDGSSSTIKSTDPPGLCNF